MVSTQPQAASEVVAGAAPPPTSTNNNNNNNNQQPISLYARKLLQKLSTLHPSASLESRQAIASWIIFNRKKCDGVGEGLLVSIMECSDDGSGNSADSGANLSRLILILGIIHQVLMSNCPTTDGSVAVGEGSDDVDTWNKSSQLRTRLGEIVILPLWKALAMALHRTMHETTTMTNRDVYLEEIENVLNEWKEHNVFGGPTVWEEYKRAWNRTLREVSTTLLENEGGVIGGDSTNSMNSTIDSMSPEIATTTQEGGDAIDEVAQQEEQVTVAIKETIIDTDESEKVDTNNMTSDDVVEAIHDIKRDLNVVEATKRESVVNIDVEVDFEVRSYRFSIALLFLFGN